MTSHELTTTNQGVEQLSCIGHVANMSLAINFSIDAFLFLESLQLMTPISFPNLDKNYKGSVFLGMHSYDNLFDLCTCYR